MLGDALHCLRALGSDEDALLAAALHALGTSAPAAEREAIVRARPGVAALLEGQDAAAQVWALHAEAGSARNQEGLRRLLLAMIQDLRVVPILLARQLARMRRMDAFDPPERVAMARLTRDLHAPLANRLGIWQLKWNWRTSRSALEPDTYQRIARLLDDTRGGREAYIAQVRGELAASLAAHGIEAEVAGRPKHIYSIWRKMQKKGVPIGEIRPARALRVLVGDVPACYAALGVAHALWTPVPGEFDDYIARPKRNDYRSLHPRCSGPREKPSKCRSAPARCTARPNSAWPRTGATRKAAPATTPRCRAGSNGCGNCSRPAPTACRAGWRANWSRTACTR